VSLPNRVVRSGKGAGLVTIRAVDPGEIVAAMEGEIVPLDAVPEAGMAYVLWLGGDRWMVPRSSGRYINHSCAPNCRVVDRPGDADGFDVVARRAIEAGGEITFAYNLIDAAEWAAHKHEPRYRFWHPSWTFSCLCGAPACQGRIDRYRIVGVLAAAGQEIEA
jgi:hypothetical protein